MGLRDGAPRGCAPAEAHRAAAQEDLGARARGWPSSPEGPLHVRALREQRPLCCLGRVRLRGGVVESLDARN
eukprot:7405476-Alexandrium_andersonii.AAC.1